MNKIKIDTSKLEKAPVDGKNIMDDAVFDAVFRFGSYEYIKDNKVKGKCGVLREHEVVAEFFGNTIVFTFPNETCEDVRRFLLDVMCMIESYTDDRQDFFNEVFYWRPITLLSEDGIVTTFKMNTDCTLRMSFFFYECDEC